MIYADEAIDAITAYKIVKNNMKDIQFEIAQLARKGSTTLLSTDTMLEMGERYNKLTGALRLLDEEAHRIWTANEEFFASSGIQF